MQALGERVCRNITRGICRNGGYAHKHGVIGYAIEVEWLLNLHGKAGWMRYRHALGKLIGVVRRRQRAERIGVEGIFGVDVKICLLYTSDAADE